MRSRCWRRTEGRERSQRSSLRWTATTFFSASALPDSLEMVPSPGTSGDSHEVVRKHKDLAGSLRDVMHIPESAVKLVIDGATPAAQAGPTGMAGDATMDDHNV